MQTSSGEAQKRKHSSFAKLFTVFKNTSLLASVYVAVQACYLCSFPTATVGIELVVNVVLRHFKPFPYFLVTRHISPLRAALSRKPKFEDFQLMVQIG